MRVQDPGGGQRLWLLLVRMDLNALTVSMCLKRGSTALDLKIYCNRKSWRGTAPPFLQRFLGRGLPYKNCLFSLKEACS